MLAPLVEVSPSCLILRATARTCGSFCGAPGRHSFTVLAADSVGLVVQALLIIDMQSALVPELWRGEELADRIALVAARARNRGDPVLAIQQTGPAGTPFDPGNPGWQLSPRLQLHGDDLRLRKSATDSFFRTNLAKLLTERGVDTLVVTGAATDYCVDATARSALSQGFDVILVEDRPACRCWSHRSARRPRRWSGRAPGRRGSRASRSLRGRPNLPARCLVASVRSPPPRLAVANPRIARVRPRRPRRR